MEKKRFTEEYLNYKPVISSLLRRLATLSEPDIEDILQETFVRSYQASLVRDIHFPKAFMVKTALRLANRHRQKSHLTDTNETGTLETLYQELCAEADDRQSPELDCIKFEELELVCDLINALPSQCRKVFIMKKIYGLSQKDISSRLHISESTVEKHVAKGILCCGQNLQSRALLAKTRQEQPAPLFRLSRDGDR